VCARVRRSQGGQKGFSIQYIAMLTFGCLTVCPQRTSVEVTLLHRAALALRHSLLQIQIFAGVESRRCGDVHAASVESHPDEYS
jgi:hypothetical protein